jgi:hypothetical protein
MALTQVSDLWVPDIWIPATREKLATFPSILNSGAVVKNQVFDAISTGGGIAATIPMWKDITDQDDEVQVEDQAPVNTNRIQAALMVGVMTNRVWKGGGTALAAQITGNGDPVEEMTRQLAMGRDKRRQKRVLATLRGAFGSAGARNGAAALSAVRLGGTTDEPFDETGLDATDDQRFSPDMFIDAKALMGELQNDLSGGLLLMHPNIKARLEKLDKEQFKTGKPSDLPFDITTYRGIPLILSEALIRAGTGDGYVYDTYLLGRGVIAFGEKPQVGQKKDVASLQMDLDNDKNNEYIWDRTREVIHLNGMKWVGNPADANNGPTNAELQTAGNWQLAYQTANRVGVVCIRTNG